ncbi:tetratricopeptide repeat protein [Pseudomarimonas salicorniae]|uniref:protein O-GlcNAc transferase n=1 Tax=Pseudomarimonas salicorniae TaxID=2933270 RepID=A0ABT0GJ80_9GAMM|nr:tetratricopeptide repeat protein [Lysobacter sp. CAU 1642]MCK7594595.1 tetratricopeptide repeat protein [Lysobacter sp. CAU 1642]
MEDSQPSLRQAEQAERAGQPSVALDHLKTHLQRHAGDARAWALAARCLRQLGGLGEAHGAAQRALGLDRAQPAAWRELGVIERLAGRPDAAERSLRQALALDPDDAQGQRELALTLARTRPAEALSLLDALPGALPQGDALLHAQLMLAAGAAERARVAFDALLQGGSSDLAVVRGAYWSRVMAGERSARRRELAAQLCALQPGAEPWLNRAQEDLEAGEFAAAREAIEEAARREPAHPGPAWARFQIPPDPAPASEEAQLAYCRAWQEGVERFARDVDSGRLTGPALIDCVGFCSAFYRHYLGDSVPGQADYGRLVGRIMAASGIAPAEAATDGPPRRIGVVSAHLREHTVARLFVPLLEQLAGDFDWHFFSLDAREDAWTQRVARIGTLHRGAGGIREWAARIGAARPDVLLYPEIGMDARTLALAALRLAPRQAALWGHPVSPGLPTLDAVLSPDALEPADGAAHYAEPLVRLPGLGHGLREADLPEPREPELNLREGEIPLLCAQTVYKLLPAQDVLFARILARLPKARLHLLVDPRTPVREFIARRLGAALEAAGVDPARQLALHGFLPLPEYLGLARSFRLNLDTLGWSGGMSALDLLAQGLPTIALPGARMRCRQTAALLERLGVGELIARNADDYVDKVVALAPDADRCAALSARLRERRGQLFDDGRVAPFLDAWLRGESAPR